MCANIFHFLDPTPTESFIISYRSNSSLQLQWTVPPGMNGTPNINYFITYQPVVVVGSGGNQTKTSTGTQLTGLMSGTLYNINITTVGPQNLSSTVVYNSSYTRKFQLKSLWRKIYLNCLICNGNLFSPVHPVPNPVQNGVAYPISTTSIKVNWSNPVDFKQYYEYLVMTYNDTGLVDSQNVSGNGCIVLNLVPGSKYCINVTTRAAPGAESIPVQICTYTSKTKNECCNNPELCVWNTVYCLVVFSLIVFFWYIWFSSQSSDQPDGNLRGHNLHPAHMA